MPEKNQFVCEFCNFVFTSKGNYYRHKKYICSVKIEQEKIKLNETQNEKNLQYEKIIETLKKDHIEIIKQLKNDYNKTIKELKSELKMTQEKMDRQNNEFILYMQENQKVSSTTLDKSVDALTFLMTHRKNAPELKEITHEKAHDMLTRENRLYDYLLHYNQENKLDQYIGEIILKYIKKENPEEQSVWNSDVSRLTYLIRDIVDESPTWLRDPNGVMFNTKIIIPVINEITNYLYRCLHSKNPDTVTLENDSESTTSETNSDSDTESETSNNIYEDHEKMKRTGLILGTIETLKSKKYRKSLSEYIASHIPLHKLSKKKTLKHHDDSSVGTSVSDIDKISIKKKTIKQQDDSSDSNKPKK